MTKIDFRVLRTIWDPAFREKEFMFGTRQAISRVTNLISGGQYSELNGLLTKPARSSLMRELERNWNDRQRSLLALKPSDIQISAPRKVYFIRIADKKYCDVDMAFLALKWVPINHIDALIFTEVFARFHREYTPTVSRSGPSHTLKSRGFKSYDDNRRGWIGHGSLILVPVPGSWGILHRSRFITVLRPSLSRTQLS